MYFQFANHHFGISQVIRRLESYKTVFLLVGRMIVHVQSLTDTIMQLHLDIHLLPIFSRKMGFLKMGVN